MYIKSVEKEGMNQWSQIGMILGCGGLVVLLILFFRLLCCTKRDKDSSTHRCGERRAERLQSWAGIPKLHRVSIHTLDPDWKRTNSHTSRRGISTKPFFSWTDHPSLITDVVENGWSRFAFTNYVASPSVRSARPLLGACGVGDQGNEMEMEVEISWDVCQDSSDLMQKIRMNSGLKKRTINSNISSSIMSSARSVIRTALPLPGPPLGNSSFPQEAYFEITILSCEQDDLDSTGNRKARTAECEKTRLIQEKIPNAKENSDCSVHLTSNSVHGNNKIEELNIAGKGSNTSMDEVIMVSLGLTGDGSSLPLKLPGSYPDSIGFNSDGSIYLDGLKLVFESEKENWERVDKVIGCGYNPSQRKVFFTIDSELVHVISCKSEEFSSPLYPTLAANTDVMVLVNLGQSAFKYTPANAHRTPNPCFFGSMSNSPSLGFEDSKELFSMGRIDSQWHNKNNRGAYSTGSVNNYDEESDGDLFEIVLDNCGRSYNTVAK